MDNDHIIKLKVREEWMNVNHYNPYIGFTRYTIDNYGVRFLVDGRYGSYEIIDQNKHTLMLLKHG